MIGFSPGVIQSCFELLRIASRNSLSFTELLASFSYIGSLPTAKVMSTAQGMRWLYANNEGIATITSSGFRLLNLSSYQPMLRQALLDYVKIERPPWMQNATYGRSRVIHFAGTEIAQVFVEAGLAYGIDDDVVSFWDSIAALARGQQNSRLSEIGREGEKLTIAHEEMRTGRIPKWVAIDNNEDGYDILSIVELDDARPLSIEVKASTMGLAGSLHLTRNEWERSLDVENHIFHLWAITSKGKNALAVVRPDEMQNHIPTNSGSGSWQLVEIPFSVFHSNFAAEV